MTYSYKMLMVPASKVSVPLTVVMRTRSKAPPRAPEEPPTVIEINVPLSVRTPLATQVFEPSRFNTTAPRIASVAAAFIITKPAVDVVMAALFALFVRPDALVYPVVVTLPEPI